MHGRAQLESYANVLVLRATSNATFLGTHDGVDTGGFRVGQEIQHTLAEHKGQITHISIVGTLVSVDVTACLSLRFTGHSLGGLYARYVVGFLEASGVFDLVTPVNFMTLASPHLGESGRLDSVALS